ncbi:MAG: hypothetical protein QE280_03785 [Caulobacter sp.]|nr:hypothetical protein [Caulobacter sp.]
MSELMASLQSSSQAVSGLSSEAANLVDRLLRALATATPVNAAASGAIA